MGIRLTGYQIKAKAGRVNMNCYEVTECPEERRASCLVFRNFQNKPGDMGNISCWVLKRGDPNWTDADAERCRQCSYYLAVNHQGVTVSYGRGDAVVIECGGALNLLRTQVLGEVADKLKCEGKCKVALDLSAVTNIYSCAMSMMVRLHLQCEEMGGLFVMAGATGYVKVAIDAVLIDKIVKCVETMDEALALIVASVDNPP
ncbi:MAG: STAS domain-containing protein [Chitinispirillales bacterium]|jgi:anti-anti-sigma regulatory factor|nr:STAS domain-containing protein [Chitinispirillales bacterium]